jgi:hypothetical protein
MTNAFEWGRPQLETVDFFGERLFVLPGRDDDETMIVLKPICEHLGIGLQSQSNRLQQDPLYAGRCKRLLTPSAGGEQKPFCLSLSMLPAWLFSIHSTSVRDDIGPKLVRYQLKCARVLHDHFFGRHRSELAREIIADALPIHIPLIDVKESAPDLAEPDQPSLPRDPLDSLEAEVVDLMAENETQSSDPGPTLLRPDDPQLSLADRDALERAQALIELGGAYRFSFEFDGQTFVETDDGVEAVPARGWLETAIDRLILNLEQAQLDIEMLLSNQRLLLTKQHDLAARMIIFEQRFGGDDQGTAGEPARPINPRRPMRPRATGCTCGPRPIGLFPRHHRVPLPCPVHQADLPFGDDFDAAH